MLAARTQDGYWIGRLASSALYTATAISALAVFRKKINDTATSSYDAATLEKIDALVKNGIEWLIARQQRDGGWGDTEQSPSNPATTLLVQCAILLSQNIEKAESDGDATVTCGATTIKNHPLLRPSQQESTPEDRTTGALVRADLYLRRHGGLTAVEKRYGNDRTFSVPILMNAALAGVVPWSDVPPLPFELARFPQSLFRLLKMPVVSYAIPALVAIGQVIHEKNPTKNFFLKIIRSTVRRKTLAKILQMQPESGGFLEATPLTAFVVMSLSSCDARIAGANHPIVQNGLRFLLNSAREDASWPIDTNLAGWVTTQAVAALKRRKGADDNIFSGDEKSPRKWILSIQHRKRHPFTGATPGGWAWTDLSGGVPDVDDTAGALLALKTLFGSDAVPKDAMEQVCLGLRWLLSLQNRDGGWPTFCKGWNRFPFDRSGVDLTAHAVRAIFAWKNDVENRTLRHRMNRAISQGVTFLLLTQQANGSWSPLWFGNQLHCREESPFYGTAKVLSALAELRREETKTACDEAIIKALRFAVANINEDKGFGRAEWPHGPDCLRSSVEETALMLDALTPLADIPEFQKEIPYLTACVSGATDWLVEQVESERFTHAAPIGLYFTKLWYHEDLYPILFTTSALGRLIANHK